MLEMWRWFAVMEMTGNFKDWQELTPTHFDRNMFMARKYLGTMLSNAKCAPRATNNA
jgi:hypothetical protein